MNKKDLVILRELKSKFPEEYSRLVGTIRGLEQENQSLKKEVKGKKNLTRLIRHELANPLAQIKIIMELLTKESNKFDADKIKEFAGYGVHSVDTMERILNITQIIASNYSKEGILENAVNFYLGDLLTSKNYSHERSLNENQIALSFKYNKKINHDKIAVFSSESLFDALLGTLIGNSVNYAPSKSKIRQGLREYDGNLEFRIENYFAGKEQRKLNGTGEGIGLKFADEFVKMLNGKIENYSNDSRINKTDYIVTERFGYKGELSESDSTLFGIELQIPMSELTQPRKPKQ
jgi:signal transduction histidine kinase